MSYTGETGDTSGIKSTGIDLQVGLYDEDDSKINLKVDLFKNASVSGLFKKMRTDEDLGTLLTNAGLATTTKLNTDDGYKAFAAACSGLKISGDNLVLQDADKPGAAGMIGFVDKAIDEISNRITKFGAAQNRVTSALSGIDIQSQNIVSSLSTLRDTDVADESSKYIQAQILQQASATLLATANQTPSIALNLI